MSKTLLPRRDYQKLAQFRRALRLFLAFSAEAAKKAGLTPAQHQALLAIKGMPDRPTIGALADWLGVRPHSAAGLVERLVLQGLVRKKNDADDRRRVFLALTPAAERKLKTLSLAHREELRGLFDGRAAYGKPRGRTFPGGRSTVPGD